MYIEGAISIKAAINNKKREVYKVYLLKNKKTKDFNYIRKIVKNNNIELIELDNFSVFSLSKTHGGIFAEVSNRKEDEFVDEDIFFLDGIEDPFNIAYAMRTLYAFGFKNVLLSNRDYLQIEPQLLKSSAGSYDMLNIQISKDIISEINNFKSKGYYIYGLYRSDKSKDVFVEEYAHKSLFIIGGEKRGINSSILNLCDEHLYIPYASDFRNALNASAALDVLATLVYKQKK